MELRHLRYFTAVAEHLNYSEAARRLHVAQPAVSQTVLDLEEELGLPLLLRDRRTVRLTAAGEIFRREALDILRRQEEATRLARRAARGEVGRLRIGFFSTATALFLPGLVQEYHRRFPDVELSLLELTPGEQLAAFDEDRIDVGFSRALPIERQQEFHEELVYKDCLHLVLPAVHRLVSQYAKKPAVPVAHLARERFVLFHRRGAPALYDEALSLCARAGDFTPQVINEPGMMVTVLLLVESGLGISLVPGCIRHVARAGAQVVFKRVDPFSNAIELRLHWRRQAPVPPTVKAFGELVASRQAVIRQTMETKHPDVPGRRATLRSSKLSHRSSHLDT